MDVILIFVRKLSHLSGNTFVIESYKNLKQDSTDISTQTLLTISQTLMRIANGSQSAGIPPGTEAETPVFQPSARAICVNVLWFLSLSLSVGVSLISMLAKEWCMELMSGRAGSPVTQVRRRQQRWDGLVKWKMEELIMLLPSLIHLSLLLFAIGLCIFLWDVHYGVAIPVVIVTALSTSAYFACTVVPFWNEYCPYGTVLSRFAKQFVTIRSKYIQESIMQDKVTANALHWMIATCETPRSVDIALQSLAAADESLPIENLEKYDAWEMIRHRLKRLATDKQSEHNHKAAELYARAVKFYLIRRSKLEVLTYGYNVSGFSQEQKVALIQFTIQILINRLDITGNIETTQLLHRCAAIGQYYISSLRGDDANSVMMLPKDAPFEQTIVPYLLLGTLWIWIYPTVSYGPWGEDSRPEALDYLWAMLMLIAYSDSSHLKHLDTNYLTYGLWYLLTNPSSYNLSRIDCMPIERALQWVSSANGFSPKVQSIYHAYYIYYLRCNITTMADQDAFAPQVLTASTHLRRYSPWDDDYLLPTIEIYILLVKYLCTTSDITSSDRWRTYWTFLYSPIPKCSPQLVQLVSSSDLITLLSNGMGSENHNARVFATAQLGLFFYMALHEVNRQSPTLSALEAELLKHPALENDLGRLEAVAEELEAKLLVSVDGCDMELRGYAYRVLEAMLQHRSTPLPEIAHDDLNHLPKRLRGIESFVNYETERSVAYPDLSFNPDGRPRMINCIS
ncbi:unnamed protein product [Rhizoctonia solani]|uniref:DUF6535 domain-containing protein n=1 Tax=Rhizoctonia solani TaxID=456999 RepID=A0A8H3DX59_9AGAM|nr:unnamed protein product [Rhizoctonia solani]